MREFELAADIYTFMKELGAEDNFLLMSASQHNLAVRAAGRRILQEGDVILGEITPCFDGQFVQICRTTILGSPPPVFAEKYSLVQRAMRREAWTQRRSWRDDGRGHECHERRVS